MKTPRLLLALVLFGGAACGVIDGLTGSPGGRRDEGGGTDGGGSGPGGGGDGGVSADERRWHGPVQLEQGLGTRSDAPRVAVRPDGRVFATWSDPSAHAVWLATRSPRAPAWDAPKKLPSIASFPIQASPQVAVGASGKAVLLFEAWDAATASTTSIRAARFGDDLVVNAADIVRLDAAGSSSSAQLSERRSLAVDEEGRAVAAWADAAGLSASTSPSGGGWSAPVTLDASPDIGLDYLDLAASRGQALLTWRRGDTAYARLTSTLDGTLAGGEAHSLAEGPPGADGTWSAVALRERVGLTVFRNGDLLSSALFRDGGFKTSIPSVDERVSYEARVALDKAGHAVAVWQRPPPEAPDSREADLYAATFDGAAWSAPRLISVPGAHRKATSLGLDVDERGDAVAAWCDFDQGGTYARIWANVLRASTGTWTGPVAIDQPSPDADLASNPAAGRFVNVALTPDGSSATVVWVQGEPNRTPHVWANWLE